MAEQLNDNSEGMSDEYNKDIDVKDVLHCDPCTDEGIQFKAAEFCVDCSEYLCTECCKSHKRSRPSRNHVLKDINNLPKSRSKRERKSEQCQEHQNGYLNWYCKSHDKCICDICKQVNHRKCTDVKSVTDVSQDFLSSDKLKKVKDRLTQLQTTFERKLLRVKENNEAVERYYKAAIGEVISSISKIRNEDLERLKALEVTCDTTVKTIGFVLNKIELLKQKGEEDQTFVATRKAESQLQEFDNRLESVENDNKITRYTYVCERSGNADGMIGKMFAWKDRHALNIDDFNVKTSADTSDCLNTGIERLSDNRLVIADYSNAKIKLVDMTSKTVISELKLEWTLWDLTRIDDNTIAVTTFNSEKILLVSISDTLTVQKTIDTIELNYCQGIVCSNNTLIVSFNGPNQIQILNLNGTVKQVIEDKDAHGTAWFGSVSYLTKGIDTNIIYLSDTSSDKVSSMTLDGQVISSFTHEHLRYPYGITVGRDGQIFVCSFNTNKIFQISSDLSEGQVILDEKDGITQPRSILFDAYKLYVLGSNNLIQIFLL